MNDADLVQQVLTAVELALQVLRLEYRASLLVEKDEPLAEKQNQTCQHFQLNSLI